MRNLGIKSLDVYITGRCNYKCGYCYGENDNYPDMSLDTYRKVLEFAKYIATNNIQLCGGEPLLCKNFEEYTIMAKEHGFGVILRTNGFFLENFIDFVAVHCLWVGVSIDGLVNSNNLMRASKHEVDAAEKFMRPINAIRKLKQINPTINIILASLASKLNYKELPELATYIQDTKLPINKWKIYEFIRDKFRSNDNYLQYEMTEADFMELIASMPSHINGAEVIFQSAHTERVGANCLIVYQNGDINLSGVHYGNINRDRFDVIINRLYKDDVLTVIKNNKNLTYGDKNEFV